MKAASRMENINDIKCCRPVFTCESSPRYIHGSGAKYQMTKIVLVLYSSTINERYKLNEKAVLLQQHHVMLSLWYSKRHCKENQ